MRSDTTPVVKSPSGRILGGPVVILIRHIRHMYVSMFQYFVHYILESHVP